MKRLCAVLVLVLAAATLAACEPCDPLDSACVPPPPPEPLALTDLGPNPWAAAQPTAWGREIHEVEVDGGRTYVGYGDWQENTGPVEVSSFGDGGWVDHFTAGTESIDEIEPIDGVLWVPYTDPRTHHDFARSSSGGWNQYRTLMTGEAFYHVFDVVEHAGSIFLIGTQYPTSYGLVMRSDDGGATWQESLVTGVGTPYDYLTYGVELNGALYTEGYAGSYRLDDATGEWALGPPFTGAFHHKALSIGGRAINIEFGYPAGNAFVFDETGQLEQFWQDRFIDVDADDSTGIVYALRQSPEGVRSLWSSTDLLAWTQLPTAIPPAATALDVDHGIAWIGDADSHLWAVGT